MSYLLVGNCPQWPLTLVSGSISVSACVSYVIYDSKDFGLYVTLKESSLVASSIKVHLAAISAFHPCIVGRNVCSNPMCARFLKCLESLFPSPDWDLHLVLSALMDPLFIVCLLFVVTPVHEGGLSNSHHLSEESRGAI